MHQVQLTDGPVEVRGAAACLPDAGGLRPSRLAGPLLGQVPDDFMQMCLDQPAGVRLAFRTSARRLELDVRVLRAVSANRPPDGQDGPVPDGGWWDLVVDGEPVAQARAAEFGRCRLDYASRRADRISGPVTTLRFDTLPGRKADVELWLPFSEVVTLLALRADGPVAPPRPQPLPRWVHHGSSISHGASADRPTGSWPAVAARAAGLELVNLGLSGNAVLDPFIARAIRDQPADLITLKLGINVVNHDCMRRRVFRPAVEGFLDTVREGHPSTPVLVISPILCPMVEDCPGPTEIDPAAPPDVPVFRTLGRPEQLAEDKLNLRLVREDLVAVVTRRRAAGDGELGYLDGRRLYGAEDWVKRPMPDLLHPDAVGHRWMGERLAALLPGLVPGANPPDPATGAATALAPSEP